MADAQVWTVIALLAASKTEIASLRTELKSDIAELRNDLRWHAEHNHRPSA